MPNDSNRPDVAVFIDFENVYVSVRDKLDANPNFESIMDRCEDFGRVVIARAYADWYRYPRVTSALYANGIEPMYVPTYYYDRDLGRTGRAIKNSVDMNLCIDAMKTLFTNTNIAKFVLATGDRDFIPLVNSIRQHGKEVIIIGIGGAASSHLAQSADEFIFYETLVGKKPVGELHKDQPRAKMPEKGRAQPEAEEEPVPEREPEREALSEKEATESVDIYDVLVDAINLARARGYVCSFGSLKLLMKELTDGEFKEGRYKDSSNKPFAKFKDFVLEAERRGRVQVFTSGTVNEVFLPGEDPYKLSQFAQDLKEEPAVPLLEVPTPELRTEARATTTNGRRRRRRPRGGQRAASTPPSAGTQDDETAESVETEEIEYTPPGELLLPDLANEDQADAVFDTLLERVEDEESETQALAALDPLEILEPPPPVPDEPVVAPVEATRSFSDDEWRVLREILGRFERPVPFAQIHNALRDARNSAGITRTNEELRTLIKQAINSGMLERSGKGNHIVYRLAHQAEEPAERIEESTSNLIRDEDGAPDQAEMLTSNASDRPEFYTPEAAAQAEMATPQGMQTKVVTAADSTIGEAAPKPARGSRPRRKSTADAPVKTPVAEVPVEAASAKPKRGRSKKAGPPADEPAEAAPPAKSKRTRRKTDENVS